MSQPKYGQIIAQGRNEKGVRWQDVMLTGTGEIKRVPAFDWASLNDLVRLEYKWGGNWGGWIITERIPTGIQKSVAPSQNTCLFCYRKFVADLPMCEHPGCAAACEHCLIPSKFDPDVKACPDHIDALNRQMEGELWPQAS